MDSNGGEIFISYKSERRRAAQHLAETLRRHGYTVWFDYQLVKGRDFARQIDARIRAARALIVLWCTLSVHSEWVGEEVDLAKHLGILIPAKIEDCDLPVGDRRKDYIDLIHWDGSPRSYQLDGLLAAVATKVRRDPQPSFRALQEYEAIWRRFGAPSLKAFALEAPLEASVGARPLAGPPAVASLPQTMPGIVRVPRAEELYRADGRIKIDAKFVHGAPDGWFKPGAGNNEWFKEDERGPEMVVVPAGSFIMGSNDDDRAQPLHQVEFTAPFAVGRYAVTHAEWEAGGLSYRPDDRGWGRGRRPVVCVSWQDACGYARELSERTGKEYRLLSEAAWEYCCRAGTTTKYAFGDIISRHQAQFTAGQTAEIGTFPPNEWGLYDMHGNVWEWCEDNWHPNYQGAPQDGSVWGGGDVSLRVLRGGSWSDPLNYCRSADRLRGPPSNRDIICGFRLGRTL